MFRHRCSPAPRPAIQPYRRHKRAKGPRRLMLKLNDIQVIYGNVILVLKGERTRGRGDRGA